ncbi:alpha-2-macroglobulin receptor-associated protein [Pteropus vampyrus]|uniref:Alpha-2-macroglobulin receptor-associated protein n=1 Tax=Pteropus vampyrus TaxID=132908 RepID=A0A6P6BK24_PTEVA|nr:alpha-2-macroglobulin receptor-associated protein [Pteropus vampyrus]
MAPRRFGSGLRGLLVPLPLLLLLLLLLVPWPAAGHGGKYSRERNEPEWPPKREPGGEFRMEKLNQLWEKAQRLQLSPVELSELHADLKIQERDEFSWKKLKAEGLDEDGEEEAKLRRSLSVILAKYGLDGRKDARAVSGNSLGGGMEQDSLEDPRLEKLWHKAKTSGKFSRDELDKLWREFQHHREKVREYDAMLEALSRTEDIQENAIDPAGGDVVHGALAPSGSSRWAAGHRPCRACPRMCLALGILERPSEELKHFEVKIEKHNHYQKQLEISHQKLKHVERFGDHEHVGRNRERYAALEEKTKELGYKVKKHLQDLSSRISRARHNEL